MDNTFGTFELAMAWPDGHEERIPYALIREAFTSLPDEQGELRAALAAWTRSRVEVTEDAIAEELEAIEKALLNATHTEMSDFGLLNKISFRSEGRLVNPNGLPEDWLGIRAPFVLAVAVRRFRLFLHALGVRVRFVDIDAGAFVSEGGV